MIHFVGWPLRIGRRVRQRCAWCGETLEDVDLALVFVPAGSDGWRPWEPGKLLRIEGNLRSILDHEDHQSLPLGTCADRELPPVV